MRLRLSFTHAVLSSSGNGVEILSRKTVHSLMHSAMQLRRLLRVAERTPRKLYVLVDTPRVSPSVSISPLPDSPPAFFLWSSIFDSIFDRGIF